MRTLGSIFLLFCLVFPFAGTYTWLEAKKHKTRKEVQKMMKKGMDKEELLLLKFSIEEAESLLNWRHSKEFEFGGEMYDIVEKQIVGDSVYYQVWHDCKETRLHKKTKKLITGWVGQDSQKKEQSQKLAQWIGVLYCHTLAWQLPSFCVVNDPALFAYNALCFSISSPPSSPPPEFV